MSDQAQEILQNMIDTWTPDDALAVKALEATTNHDVKALEYWMRDRFSRHEELKVYSEWIHFACTSEDINNIAYSLMLRESRDQVLLPVLDTLIGDFSALAHTHADRAMMARTHGQPATPTTLGKEYANIAHRLTRERDKL
jgi:adenylosuccinate lyase